MLRISFPVGPETLRKVLDIRDVVQSVPPRLTVLHLPILSTAIHGSSSNVFVLPEIQNDLTMLSSDILELAHHPLAVAKALTQAGVVGPAVPHPSTVTTCVWDILYDLVRWLKQGDDRAISAWFSENHDCYNHLGNP